MRFGLAMMAAGAAMLAGAAPAQDVAAPADAYPAIGYGAAFPYAPRGGLVPPAGDGGLNAFFYPDGYDPQYGSQGRVADVGEFAATYGCRPVWNGRYGRYVAACND